MARILLGRERVAYQPLIRTSTYPYHVTGRSNNRDRFYVSLEKCWELFGRELAHVHRLHSPEITSFVLMPNHFHMILWTPRENLDRVMNDLLREVSQAINQVAGRINHVFGARYKWCVIDSTGYLFNAYKYVYRNPLDLHTVKQAQMYPFSTLTYVCRGQRALYPLYDEKAVTFGSLPVDMVSRLSWINADYHPEERRVIRNALRRKRFQFSEKNDDRKWIRSLQTKSP